MLAEHARLLGIRLNRSEKKELMAKRLADTILRAPMVLLRKLTYHELLKLREMVFAADHTVEYRSGVNYECLILTGLVHLIPGRKLTSGFISAELADTLKPVIDDYIATLNPNSGRVRNEAVITGLLNLYGLLSFPDLVRLCAGQDKRLTADVVTQTIYNSYLLSVLATRPDNSSLYYSSPYMDNPGYFLEEINRRQLAEARFSREEVLAAAHPEHPQPPENEMSSITRKLLMSVLDSDETVNWWISVCWMEMNSDRDSMNLMMRMLEKLNLTVDQLNRVFAMLTDWTNLMPRWILRGNSPRFVFEKYEKPLFSQKPPTLVMGPNARKAGINFSQDQFDALWKENFKKTGRNDPCPCGSGKKYKHCCGK